MAGTTTNRSYAPYTGDSDLFRRYAAGDLLAREALLERHMPMVERLVARYARSSEAREDLLQSGYVGLLKAIDRYEPAAGSFVSYAIANVVGEVKRHFRDKGWAMKVGRTVQEHHLLVEPAIEQLTAVLGRSPTPREVARETGLSTEQVLEALAAGEAYSLTHLEAPAARAEETASTIGDTVGATDVGFTQAEYRADLAPAFGSLDDRERQILYLRFVEDLNQREIGARVGVSQMHVSRLIRRAVERMASEIVPDGRGVPA